MRRRDTIKINNELKRISKYEKECTINYRTLIITYEWGKALKEFCYYIRFDNYSLSEFKIEFSQMLTMINLLCIEIEIDFPEIYYSQAHDMSKEKGNEPVDLAHNINFYLGMLSSEILKDDEIDQRIIANIMSHILYTMNQFCLYLGFDSYELRAFGLENLKERFKDFENKGWKKVK